MHIQWAFLGCIAMCGSLGPQVRVSSSRKAAAMSIVRALPVISRGKTCLLIFLLPWRSQGSPSKLFGKQRLSKAQGVCHRVSLESDQQAKGGPLGPLTVHLASCRVLGQGLAYIISVYLATGQKTPTRSFSVWSCNVILYFSCCWITPMPLD